MRHMLEVRVGSTVGGGGPACYASGTRLTVPEGAVAVEDLTVGTMVLTAGGEAQPVRWIGHRSVNCSLSKNPSAVWPICIRAGALVDGRPSRDLWVSPGHSILVGDVLIPAEKLVNGATVVQVQRERVQYWHVELDRHDVLLAEDLPAESYLDTGNRSAFINGGDFIDSHPDFKPKHWAETCAPLVLEGEVLQRARASLLSRALELGYERTVEADAHIVADGMRIEPVSLPANRLAFLLPSQCSKIELRSRSFTPAHVDPASNDTRSLGLCVGRLLLDGAEISLLEDAAFSHGWHAFERDCDSGWRWTQDRVPLAAGTRLLLIDLARHGQYWSRPVSDTPHIDSVAAGA